MLVGFFILCRKRRLRSGSSEFDFLSRIVRAKTTWKSSAIATKEILKGEFRFLQETAKDYLCQKLKIWSDMFG